MHGMGHESLITNFAMHGGKIIFDSSARTHLLDEVITLVISQEFLQKEGSWRPRKMNDLATPLLLDVQIFAWWCGGDRDGSTISSKRTSTSPYPIVWPDAVEGS